MINWNMKSELWLLWENKKDQKNDDKLRKEIWSVIVIREQGSKSDEKSRKNSKCYSYGRVRKIKSAMSHWEEKWENMIIMREKGSKEQ
jgi:hypothetical protein